MVTPTAGMAAASRVAAAKTVSATPEAMPAAAEAVAATAEAVSATTEAVSATAEAVSATAEAGRGIVPSAEGMESAGMAGLPIRPRKGIGWRPAEPAAETRRRSAVRLRRSRVSQAAPAAVILHGSSVRARAIPWPLTVTRERLRTSPV